MESHLLQYFSDNESSVGGGGGDGDGDNNYSSLCGGVITSAPTTTTLFQCWDCFWLFSSEAALIEHQQLQMCSLAAKAMGFMERFRQAQQQADTDEEGTGTNDPFGDGNNTLDLVSPMDHYYDFRSPAAAASLGDNNNNNNKEELDLELKL